MVRVAQAAGEPAHERRQLHPFWLPQEYCDDIEEQLLALPRHSFESDPDQLHPSCWRHAAELRYDPHDRADPLHRPLLEQSLPHSPGVRAAHAVGVPRQLAGGAHSARAPTIRQRSGLVHA